MQVSLIRICGRRMFYASCAQTGICGSAIGICNVVIAADWARRQCHRRGDGSALGPFTSGKANEEEGGIRSLLLARTISRSVGDRTCVALPLSTRLSIIYERGTSCLCEFRGRHQLYRCSAIFGEVQVRGGHSSASTTT